ncbi:MDIS1-interacting receptor like kinase 2 [Citrus sinensis]|uniref:MDIS1-interacting receptor like kinase 2 n=1 Tax=Citrus sinensis TaxID=2711 RepID=A0ACB8MUP0_CITSI|nr:MDIS1-interacting receptor like kinase 2 [Citrus sinensis]KAH9789539.1 MDIS1-interacting receptor like kinase 2 [Citrus sinensis]
MGLPILNILILFLLLTFSYNVSSDSTKESYALLNWKTSLQNQNPNSSLLSSWTLYPANATKISPCTWFGIFCNLVGRVISISLSSLGLNGTFQDFSFSSFPHLMYLNLSCNVLYGNIPPQISNLSKLRALDLGNNQLSGSLFELDLSENQLFGSIPLSFSNLSSLTLMSLFNNSLSGSIPPTQGNLEALSELGLYINQLDGVIPPSIGNLSSLRTLYLYDNGFYGLVPNEIGYLKSLSKLELCRNHLSGVIPHSIGNLTKLVLVNMCENHLFGLIPKSFRNLTSLERLRFNQNNLFGKVYEAFGDHPNLTFLDLSQNNLYGEISFNWRNFPKLGTFNASMNNIYGSIPPEIGDSSKLQVLDLSSNHIVGKIPVQFEKLFSLNKLILNLNQLSGGVPLEFGSLTELQYLDLSANKLSSSIPKSMGNLSKLHYLNLSNNQFNHKIPTEFEKLIHLSELDLSHNFLQGEIPPQICNMESLEELNLSHNNLFDLIPGCFEEMRSLSRIDIAYNELQGPIPNSTAFKDGLMEGNKGLCGNFKALPSCDAFMSHEQTSRKKWVVIVFPILGMVVLLIGLFGFFLFFGQRKRDSQEKRRTFFGPKATDDFGDPFGFSSVLNFNGKFLYEEIIKAIDDFGEKYCIGKGRQGSVYKAELPSGIIFAVKKFNSQLLFDEMADQDEFLNEVLALTEIRHRNIIKFHGFCSNAQHSFIVSEYLDRGSLTTILKDDAAAKEFGWNQRMNVIKGVANALSYLHHDCLPPIVHGDISSKNVLLDSEHEAHVSDFGIAKFLNPHSSNWTAFAGTFGYAAPEIAHMMRATEKYDVHSFGVLALEVIKGNHPRDYVSTNFSSFSNMITEINQNLDHRLPTPSRDVMDKLMSIMEVAILCLVESPEARPTMKKVCNLLCK